MKLFVWPCEPDPSQFPHSLNLQIVGIVLACALFNRFAMVFNGHESIYSNFIYGLSLGSLVVLCIGSRDQVQVPAP